MESKLKQALDKSLSELKGMQEVVDDLVDDFPDDIDDVRELSRSSLKSIREMLDKAVDKAGHQAEETQLQAHLGLMEAQDKLEASRGVIESYVSRAAKESSTFIDRAEVQAQLARMEANDFWEQRGSKIAEEFKESADTMREQASQALDDLQNTFNQWNQRYRNRDN